MKLYIWEGNGISDAYHDDGTLVVLAESPEQAREVARADAQGWPDRIDYADKVLARVDAAIDREPDRVVDIDTPTVVAFNGGGYD